MLSRVLSVKPTLLFETGTTCGIWSSFLGLSIDMIAVSGIGLYTSLVVFVDCEETDLKVKK